ncbi:hypothetical protein E3N88_00118 [Mikania micrantha]|uniref:Protein kinase domain-containing protein n=1 Tax=Mikania micrantha TaxID=192012 RepID=A0A5N6PXM4_9ASTR|nr:hypothetical protein E3N88_00118 [Mikania micrantha]
MASTVTKIAHLRIPLEDVEKATNNYHRDKIISRGDFGPAYCWVNLDRKQREDRLLQQQRPKKKKTVAGKNAFIPKEANRYLAQLAKHHYENKTLKVVIYPNLWNQMLRRSLMKYSKSAYSCIMDERAFRANMDDVVADLEKDLEFQSRLEKLEEMHQHLNIRLEDIKSAANNFSNPYSPCEDNPRFIRFQHPNIITLLGFCVESSELILVFEKNPNSHHMLLCSSLQNDNFRGVLTWEKGLKIAVDIARALNYLHFEREDKKVIIHNGTKCCNVCLDENWNAKIENFEGAEFLNPNQEDEALYLPYISRNVSPFHLDPEYTKTGLLKRESDVYSFGVVLFKILCGKKAADPIYLDYGGHQTHVARSRFAAGTVESMIDPAIIFENKPNKDSLDTYTEIAYNCVAETQAQRPTMKVIHKELEKSLSFQLLACFLIVATPSSVLDSYLKLSRTQGGFKARSSSFI